MRSFGTGAGLDAADLVTYLFGNHIRCHCSVLPFRHVSAMGDFEDLYAQHVGAVFRYSMSCVGRRDVAEDITSEAFLALYRNFSTIDRSQLPGWLLTVAKNRARDYWRHAQVEQRHLRQAAAPMIAPPAPMETLLLDSKVLKPVHRLCLMLRYLYGMSLSEIAAQTGMSETQVKGHLQYGRRLLREQNQKVS